MENKEEQKRLITEIMEADEKDGLYKEQTAVDWLREQIKDTDNKESKLPLADGLDRLKRAKEKENEQRKD